MARRRERKGAVPRPGRRPVDVQAASGFLAVRDQIWAAVRARHALGRPFTRADIAFDTKASEGTVRSYMERLAAGKYLTPTERQPRSENGGGQFRFTPYVLARDAGLEAPRLRADGTLGTQGGSNERIWRTAKILREFDARDLCLAIAAAKPERPVDLVAAKNYLAHLARARYIRCIAAARGGNGRSLARYRFVPAMNTGPRAPMVQRTRAIFDPNLNQVVWRPK